MLRLLRGILKIMLRTLIKILQAMLQMLEGPTLYHTVGTQAGHIPMRPPPDLPKEPPAAPSQPRPEYNMIMSDDPDISCEICHLVVKGSQYAKHCQGRGHRENSRLIEEASNTAVHDEEVPALETEAPLQVIPDQKVAAEDDIDVVPVQIPCYTMSGRNTATVLLPSNARWSRIAVAVMEVLPDFRALPPVNARSLTAADVTHVNVVAFPAQ